MKEQKKPRISDFCADVAEHIFVEWLIRNGLYSAFKTNYERFCTQHKTFREDLRTRIRNLRPTSRFTLSDIIECSFPFLLTPEGFKFWSDQSILWRKFCKNLDFIL